MACGAGEGGKGDFTFRVEVQLAFMTSGTGAGFGHIIAAPAS